MSFDITRQSLFKTILYFLIFYTVFRSREYLFPAPGAGTEAMMPLEKLFYDLMGGSFILNEVVTFLLTFINSFYISRILSRNLIFLERTYMPSLIYLIVSIGYCASAMTPVTLTVAFLVLFAIESMIASHKRREQFGYFLHAAVALGFTPLLYPPAAVLVLLLPVGFIIFRRDWRDMVTALTGYLLPLFFCSYVLWGMGESFWLISRQICDLIITPVHPPFFWLGMNVWDYALTGIYFGATGLSLFAFAGRYKNMRSRAFNGYLTFIWTLAIMLGMLALPCRDLSMLPLVAIPLAVIIPTYFNRRSGWLPNLFYAIILLSILTYNILPLIR